MTDRGEVKDEMKGTFEERLERLEEIGEILRDGAVPLGKASELFQEGVTLAQKLEAELRAIEKRIEVVINNEGDAEETPVLELFPELDEG